MEVVYKMADADNVLYVNGLNVSNNLTKYNVNYSDIDSNNSGRSESGVMFRDRVRSNVAKIELGWQMLTDNDLETILNEIKTSSFDVEYYFGDTVEATMYAGDRQLEKVLGDRWNLSVNFIEF